ncbi:glutamate-cysteine ligase family protein [Hahella sp. CR1]|uniref:glutamate-cysteine ligase family protein n=1 Tax=Hahella sp. CR1 TaxID=2992807 RepID=UPI0024419597|nr:glutamate-cysteine ligase family protein [Hahella sp. CR1]MDG9666162.1 glutamate-cysteine ligase family protein [Hahella sp. CR1]
MGRHIDKARFSAQEYVDFQRRLQENLATLRSLLDDPAFGVGPPSFGAELELYIIDKHGRPTAKNQEIQAAVDDPNLTLELNRFNLEYNLEPTPAAGTPFRALQQQIDGVLQSLETHAAAQGASLLPIGILPTLTSEDMGPEAITESPRYQALARQLRDKRGEDFHISIKGRDTLDLYWQDVSLEGANTSFQFHYRVNPGDFADAFNAAQLATPLAVALAANSPLFLGRRLWHETRIALFKQATDCRMETPLRFRLPARVLFGNGWVRKDAHEIFCEGVSLFEPLLPICGDDDAPRPGQAPPLDELRLHQGSIWAWNRPIYDPVDGGHIRIEIRALPAGPSTTDMLANAALMVGLIEGLRPSMQEMLPAIPFRYCEYNFYRAAKYGLRARLFWPGQDGEGLQERPVMDILEHMLPVAEQGLNALPIDPEEIRHYLGVCSQNLAQPVNGALWQLRMLEKLRLQRNDEEALRELVIRYQDNYRSGEPLHRWTY